MKLPPEISIKGAVYQVVVTKDLPEEFDGLFDPDNRKVSINANACNDTQMRAFIHEIGHVMCYELGLRQTSFHLDLEEIIVENFSNMIVDFFKVRFR